MQRMPDTCSWVKLLFRLPTSVFNVSLSPIDIVDYMNPQMLIVGSRGLGQLNG